MEFNQEDIKKKFDEAKQKIGKVNIAIIGKTGVGKSTLINAIFGENLAETGIGRPVTQNCKEYSKEGFPINLLDTKGFEIENYKNILEQLRTIIQSRKTSDPSTHIHLAWYCINSTSNRIEDAEIKFINELGEFIPVVVVLTQSINSNRVLSEQILMQAPNIKQIICVLAQDYEVEGIGVKKAYGLDLLTEISYQLIPEAFRNAFAAAQKVNLNLKAESARKIVHAAAVAAAGACAVPLPFADAVALVPIQIGMLAEISHIMKLETSEKFLATLIAIQGSVAGGVVIGRLIFTTIMKCIPGAGTAIGATVGAATASAVTEAMGNAYISALRYIIENNLSLSPENIAATFKKMLKK